MSKDDTTITAVMTSNATVKVMEINAMSIAAIIAKCFNVDQKSSYEAAIAANEICDYFNQQLRNAQSYRG